MKQGTEAGPEALRWAVGSWPQLEGAAVKVRRAVFVEELGVEESLDIDGEDAQAIHLVAFRGEDPVVTGRLRPAHHRIERLAVLKPLRGNGLGSWALGCLIREAVRAGLSRVMLHAQCAAIGFYERHGFSVDGPEFEEAGIGHRRMQLELSWREAVAGIIVRPGQILLGLRAPHITMGGRWDLFGGKIEPGESPEEALCRELEEETSLRVKPDRLLDVILYEDARGRCLWRCPVYRIVQWNGEVRINEEHVEARWVTPAQMASLSLAHHRLIRLAQDALTGEG